MVSLNCIFLVAFLFGFGQEVNGVVIGWSSKEKQNAGTPPPPDKTALMARYIAHNSEWVSIGTKSTQKTIPGYPFVGLKSMADGPVSNGTGVPYMLMTDLDVSMKDLNAFNEATLFMTLAQGDFCVTKNYDPQDPRCARLMLTGGVTKLVVNSTEEIFAKNALYTRHPQMKTWPIEHGFYVVRFDIIQVALIDFFGGVVHITPDDYFAANSPESFKIDNAFQNFEVINIVF